LLKKELAKMPLHQLRAARRFTQQQLAATLDISQTAVSQLEQRTDMYLSTLRNFIEAMGGTLELRAVFFDGQVCLLDPRPVETEAGGESEGEPAPRRKAS
jgi:transcriptional regulator with XRE-family HTH domain